MLLSIREFWNQAMEIREARWVMSAAGLLVVLLVCVYLFKLVRDMALGSTTAGLGESTDYLTEFQKLRNEGKLNEEEYARLKESIPTARPDGMAHEEPKEGEEESKVNFLPPTESE